MLETHPSTTDYSIERGSNYVLIDVCSQIDTASADGFRRALWECNANDLPYFIVDLSSCRYIDSSGLGMLISHHRRHKNLIVIVPSDNQRNPLTSTNLANNLNFVPSREAALALTRSPEYAARLSR
jgi:anti-anti-sigma factor